MKILILAAGNSTRFHNRKSKVLASFWGTRVIDIIQAQAKKIGSVCTIVNEKIVHEIYGEKIIQDTKSWYGTGAALKQYCGAQKGEEDLLILYADMPLIDEFTLKKFNDVAFENCDIVIGVMKMPEGEERYGRIIIKDGKITQIAEYKMHKEKTEYAHTGIILIKRRANKLINDLQKNDYGEIYLTGIVQKASEADMNIAMIEIAADEALGFNTAQEFDHLLQVAQKKWRARAVSSGAILYDKETIYLSYDTKFEAGPIIEPYCYFGSGVELKANAHIKTFSVLQNCIINGLIGPFAHIRSGEIEEAQVGAFVEISKSVIKKGAKIKHLAYIGNANIGENTNVGAGVVVCNYDGKNKNETIIEANAFIGANSSLIAPINIKSGAFLGAGGVYTKNVEENELAIARAQQINKTRKNTCI